MSSQLEARVKSKEEVEAENEQLRQVAEDAIEGYTTLRRACEGVMASRDFVVKHGTIKCMLKVYEMVEKAMIEADSVHIIAYGENPERMERIWCSTCEKFLSTEDEMSGHCLVCLCKTI